MKYKIDKTRPISWSSYSSFLYNPDNWFRSYILNERQKETPEMAFGKNLATELENGTCTIVDLVKHVINKKEHKFLVKFCGIPLVGFADDFCVSTFRELNEVKTGKKAWDQNRVDKHQQFDMYLLMNYITNKVNPEDVRCRLFWLPTEDDDNFNIKYTTNPATVHIFETKRTMADILAFGTNLKKAYEHMEKYAKSYPHQIPCVKNDVR